MAVTPAARWLSGIEKQVVDFYQADKDGSEAVSAATGSDRLKSVLCLFFRIIERNPQYVLTWEFEERLKETFTDPSRSERAIMSCLKANSAYVNTITSLYFDSGTQLPLMPPHIGLAQGLLKLTVNSTGLKELSSGMRALVKLQWLDLQDNQLSELPEWIGDLENLEYLELGSNKLTSLPSSIGKLKKLTSLYLWSNQLTELPKEIEGLENLKILNTEGNKLAAAPKLDKLKKLRYLYAEGNPFKTSLSKTADKDAEECAMKAKSATPSSKERTDLKSDG